MSAGISFRTNQTVARGDSAYSSRLSQRQGFAATQRTGRSGTPPPAITGNHRRIAGPDRLETTMKMIDVSKTLGTDEQCGLLAFVVRSAERRKVSRMTRKSKSENVHPSFTILLCRCANSSAPMLRISRSAPAAVQRESLFLQRNTAVN